MWVLEGNSLTSASAAAAVVTPSVVFAPVATADCPDIEVIFARGTDDTPDSGESANAFVDSLRGKVGGRSVGSYAVNYPASYDFLAAADGANDASAHVQYMMGACPNTRLVLGGYSQGAAVMDVIAAVPIPAVGFDNPLPPNAPDFVAAIAVFGNPSAKLGLPLTIEPGVGRTVHRPVQRRRPGLPDRRPKRRRAQRLHGRAGQPGGRLRRGPAVTHRRRRPRRFVG